MKCTTRSSVPSLTMLLAFTAVSQAEEVLHSKRMAKWRIDAQGNLNICKPYTLQIIILSYLRDPAFFHVNDVHALLDEFSSSGTDCTKAEKDFYGGYSRIKTIVEEQRPNYNDTTGSLSLNISDEFQGTMLYSFYGARRLPRR